MRYSNLRELTDLWRDVGLDDVEGGELWASAAYEDFDDLWAPFPSGIGPAGAFCAALDPEDQEALRTAFARRLGDPSGPFELRARAWYAVGRASLAREDGLDAATREHALPVGAGADQADLDADLPLDELDVASRGLR